LRGRAMPRAIARPGLADPGTWDATSTAALQSRLVPVDPHGAAAATSRLHRAIEPPAGVVDQPLSEHWRCHRLAEEEALQQLATGFVEEPCLRRGFHPFGH